MNFVSSENVDFPTTFNFETVKKLKFFYTKFFFTKFFYTKFFQSQLYQ